MSMETINRPSVGETNGLVDGKAYHAARDADHGGDVPWDTPGLYISRLRLLSDPGFPYWDVSYCHGILDGQPVDVILPFSQLPKRGMRTALYAEARKTGRFIKGLFDNISTLN